MKYLFSGPGLQQLEVFCRENSLLAFDFDGTLSRLTSHHEQAQVSASTQMLLNEILPLGLTAIISGRGMTDLNTLLPFKPHYVVGNHGLESPVSSPALIKNAKQTTTLWAERIQNEFDLGRGVVIEDKAFSLSLHYRLASRKSLTRNHILKLAESLEPKPRVVMGKYIVNLIPPNSPHKGDALLGLLNLTQLSSAVYVGDDLTDEDVFRMNDSRILSIKIGKTQKSAAQFYLKHQNEVNRLLSHILFFLKNT